MKFTRLFPLLFALSIAVLSSCMKDNNSANQYSEWGRINTQAFNDSLNLVDDNGIPVYTQITPRWDPSFSVLLRWHEGGEYTDDIHPLSTSTCRVRYTLKNIDNEILDSSTSYVCVPKNMVTGFMAALMQMSVNDTVTAIIPAKAGYGDFGSGSVLPYSTLVFGIRLLSIDRLY